MAKSTQADTPAGKQGGPEGKQDDKQTPDDIEALRTQVAALMKTAGEWEKAAKDNAAKAATVDAAQKAAMTTEEKLTALEERLAEADKRTATAEVDGIRYRIASEYGITADDAAMFLTASTQEDLTAQADRLSQLQPTGPLTVHPRQGMRRDSGKASSTGDQFAEVIAGLL